MSANDSRRGMRCTQIRDRLLGFGQSRAPVRVLVELLPVLLAKAVAAALLWWVMFGAHR